MLDLARVKNLGVIGHDREMREERRGVDPIERLEQVEKEPGLLTIPHTRGDGASHQVQRSSY